MYDDGDNDDEFVGETAAWHLMEAWGALQSFASSRSATKTNKMSDATLTKREYQRNF